MTLNCISKSSVALSQASVEDSADGLLVKNLAKQSLHVVAIWYLLHAKVKIGSECYLFSWHHFFHGELVVDHAF